MTGYGIHYGIMSRFQRRRLTDSAISQKANRILGVFLVAFLMILLRVWHLSVIQHEERLEKAQRPTRRTVIEPSGRASIRDRFNIPLAINQVQYNAAVSYGEIREVPRIAWEKQADGSKVRVFRRKEHIRLLASVLADVLDADEEILVDLIHSKASYYDHLPFVIREDISEPQYYRLKALERDWLGLKAQRQPRRVYPQGLVGADVIGHIGPISRTEYDSLVDRRKSLQKAFEEGNTEVETELASLQEQSYSLNDWVGKAGVERQYEKNLRGCCGKKYFYAGSRGNFLHELPGATDPQSGQRLVLSLSAELQQYAEQLLATNEEIRRPRVHKAYDDSNSLYTAKEPWIKGGAIIALDPFSGEVLALASYPRWNPNDFIRSGDLDLQRRKQMGVRRWLETDSYIAEVWDGARPLERERFDGTSGVFYDEQLILTWNGYLNHLLCDEGEVRKTLNRIGTIRQAVAVQQEVGRLVEYAGHAELGHLFNLLYQAPSHIPQSISLPAQQREEIEANLNMHLEEVELIRQQLARYMGEAIHNQDKILVVDLLGLAVEKDKFSAPLLHRVGDRKLDQFREDEQAKWMLSWYLRPMTRELFHELVFVAWRQNHEAAFLKAKREEERRLHKAAKPYLDYLDAEETRQFDLFWAAQGDDILLWLMQGFDHSNNVFSEYFITWHRELKEGAHADLPWYKAYLTLQASLAGLSEDIAHQYLAAMRRYEDLKKPLYGRYRCLRRNEEQLQQHLAAAFRNPGGFGYGRSQAYRQSAPQGSLFKLVTAYAALSTQAPLPKIFDDAYQYGNKWYVGKFSDGTPIPQNFKGGRIPRTLIRHVGEIDLVRAIEYSSNAYFSLLAGEVIRQPMDLADVAYTLSYGRKTGIDLPGEIAGQVPDDLDQERTGLYTFAIGQHSLVVTPLQTAVMLATFANGGDVLQPYVGNYLAGATVANLRSPPQRHISLSPSMRTPLLEGMLRVTHRYQTSALWNIKQHYQHYPEAPAALEALKGQLAGKTSTAESVELLSPDRPVAMNTYNHLWFGGVSFSRDEKMQDQMLVFKDSFGQPELVVVVYLRYGAYGRDAAPLAAQMVTKWREIKAKRVTMKLSHN